MSATPSSTKPRQPKNTSEAYSLYTYIDGYRVISFGENCRGVGGGGGKKTWRRQLRTPNSIEIILAKDEP